MNTQSFSGETSDNSVVNAMTAVCNGPTTKNNCYHEVNLSKQHALPPGYQKPSHIRIFPLRPQTGQPIWRSLTTATLDPTEWQRKPSLSFPQQQPLRGAQEGPTMQSPRFCRNCGSKSCFSKFQSPFRDMKDIII